MRFLSARTLTDPATTKASGLIYAVCDLTQTPNYRFTADRCDPGKVAAWYPIVGVGEAETQPNTALQPTAGDVGGLWGVSFDSGQWMRRDNPATPVTHSAYAVLTIGDNTGGSRRDCILTSNNNGFAFDGTGKLQWWCGPSGQVVGTSAPVTGRVVVAGTLTAAGLGSVYVNGVLAKSGTATAPTTGGGIYFGNPAGNANTLYRGAIHDYALFQGVAHSAATVANVTAALRAWYQV